MCLLGLRAVFRVRGFLGAGDKTRHILGTCLHLSCLAQREIPQVTVLPKHLLVCRWRGSPNQERKNESCQEQNLNLVEITKIDGAGV